MIDIQEFDNRDEADLEKKKRHGTWDTIHTDYINGKIKVTFVNGDDDPQNSPEVLEEEARMQTLNALNQKLQDNSITFDELKEYMRLREI